MSSTTYDNKKSSFSVKLKTAIQHLPLIGPYVKPAWKALQQHIFFKPKQVARLIKRWHELFSILNKLYILLYIKRVEHYQPLYNFGIFNKIEPQRICSDRADVIYNELKTTGPGSHILDIGCSLGYFAHYFAERDYFVDGIDSNANNIAVCKLLQRVNKNNTRFVTADFSTDFIATIQHSQYDIGFIFSVFHHIIYYKGLEYAQDLAVQLLEKIPILFVELAVKHEDTLSPWRTHLPDEELAVFAKCKNISIQKLGVFRNHLSAYLRPLYIIKKNNLQIGNENYTVQQYKSVSYSGNNYLGCHYYDCNDIYIKKYSLLNCKDRLKNILNEIENYKTLPENNYFPTLLSYEHTDKIIKMVFKKIAGKNLNDLLLQDNSVDRLSIVMNVIEALEFLLQHGKYHNDIRTWNIIFDGEKAHLLDLELTSTQEIENTNTSLLWLIAQLHHFKPCNFIYPIVTPPDFSATSLQPEFQSMVTALQETSCFKRFLEWFKHY